MANVALSLATNVDGDFFVDSTCIDCDACRVIAPAVFAESGDQSAVVRQPGTAGEVLAAEKALLSCPTASIGTRVKRPMAAALSAYPEPLDGEVYFCGFTSEKSYGALSYLIVRPEGNVLIDSPRFSGPLVRNIERLGGVATMLLTHRDDVADHQKYRDYFHCVRVLHADDVTARTSSIELKPSSREPIEIAAGITMIPVPGHTRGHAVFLYRNHYLFTGDHLAWNEDRIQLYAFRSACWYSWEEQKRSMKSLLPFSFEWVLPGHGRRIQLPAMEMKQQLERCIEWM
ncbi:MAG TPA: MBL fold metallo-hydrolase [Thermoanaerobaculia bacterium]|nr:MBL fold metallo-hydrolase [Thermoanaerobaculia bacterium]